jgi:hypothetical protein
VTAAEFDFDRGTAVAPLGDGRFAGEIVDGWDIGGNANGGYLLAIAVNGLRQASGRGDPVTVTAHFLAPGRPGPLAVTSEIVKSGKRLVTVTGALWQGDRRTLQVLAAFGEVADADGFAYADGAPPELPPVTECVFRSREQGTVEVAIMDRLDIWLDPSCAGFQTGGPKGVGEPGHRAEMRGYVSFADGRPWDTLALMLACDCFPPAVFQLDMPPGWVPTVELTVQVRARPAPGPLRCRFTTRYISGELFEEDGELWDSSGRLVALSRQLALIARA